MKRKYFVAFVFKDYTGKVGHGRMQVEAERPIDDMHAIELMEKAIEEQHPKFFEVQVTNWRPFEYQAEVVPLRPVPPEPPTDDKTALQKFVDAYAGVKKNERD